VNQIRKDGQSCIDHFRHLPLWEQLSNQMREPNGTPNARTRCKCTTSKSLAAWRRWLIF
jgi:hypothetical protein